MSDYSYLDALSSSLDMLNTFLTFMWVLVIVLIIANICGVYQLIKIAKDKGHFTEGAGMLWFIGLFGTSFMLGLIVCALPDRSGETNLQPKTATNHFGGTDTTDELPEV